MKNMLLYGIILVLIILVAYLYLDLQSSNSNNAYLTQKLSASQQSQNTTQTVQSVPTTTIYAPTIHNNPIIKSGSTFTLYGLSNYGSSSIISAFILPINASYIKVTGSFTSSKKSDVAVVNGYELGLLQGTTYITNYTQQTKQILYLMQNSAPGYIINSTGSNFTITLPNTSSSSIYSGSKPGNLFYNFTCINLYVGCAIIGGGVPTVNYYLVFANLNQTANSTLSIGKTVTVNYIQ